MLFGEYAVLEGYESLLVAVNRYISTQFEPHEGLHIDAGPYGMYPPAGDEERLPFIEAALREIALSTIGSSFERADSKPTG